VALLAAQVAAPSGACVGVDAAAVILNISTSAREQLVSAPGLLNALTAALHTDATPRLGGCRPQPPLCQGSPPLRAAERRQAEVEATHAFATIRLPELEGTASVSRPITRTSGHYSQIAATHICLTLPATSSTTCCPPPCLLAPGIETPAAAIAAGPELGHRR